jgi:hypothetical protein
MLDFMLLIDWSKEQAHMLGTESYQVMCEISVERNISYSLHTHKTSHLGRRHGLQSTTLTSYFYKSIY